MFPHLHTHGQKYFLIKYIATEKLRVI